MAPEPQIPIGWALFIVVREGKRVLKTTCEIAPEMPGHPQPVKNQKRPKQEVEKEARALLAKMGLEGKEDAYPCELSGGQKQRVAIARALALRPKMLYFDEPTSALDPEITAEILRVLKGLAAEKMTMVIVTHEIDFARAVSDRVIFMDGGKVVEEGRPEEVIDNPKNERTKAFLQKLQV